MMIKGEHAPLGFVTISRLNPDLWKHMSFQLRENNYLTTYHIKRYQSIPMFH